MTDRSTPFASVLVANRGEIALRIMRTARAESLRTIAVYSDADVDAPHVKYADQAIRIGPGPAGESYLSSDRILEAARLTKAEAVHPGYGFLSENAEFAQACADAGLVFIGPSPEAIALMGDKAQAKARMDRAGVACVPGYHGGDQTDETLAAAAESIGFPVMIKAVAGGGGRGMRWVGTAREFAPALRQARNEAAMAFGADQVIVERALENPRHVEVQVIGDRSGQVVHLGERDCSVQRRHQKVIEESPCPVMTPDLRAEMGAAALKAAQAVGYEGAGTVEFLVDGDKNFFFLEMNTRLQVEHPVTELVTGRDLVALQLSVARGDPLEFSQSDVTLSGHAIEVRLYAEDTDNEFLPDSGTSAWWVPPGGQGIRVDDGCATGQVVSSHYDPMLAKVIAHGPDRGTARARLIEALGNTVLFGVTSNRDYLIRVLESPVFEAGKATTSFAATHLEDARELSCNDITLAAVLVYHARQNAAAERALGVSRALLGWASSGALRTVIWLWDGGTPHKVEMSQYRDGVLRVALAGRSYEFIGQGSDLVVDGVKADLRAYLFDKAHIHVATGNRTFALGHRRALTSVAQPVGNGSICAPMHGNLAQICVAKGDNVEPGTRLAVLEAMKMRHDLCADVAGIVRSVAASVGAQVRQGDLLVEIEVDGE